MDEQARAWYAGLPRKRVGTGALLLNAEGQLLLVKPVYKPHWSIPGGVVDADESPWQACRREIGEEISLSIDQLRLLCLSWCFTPDKGESLQFLYGAPVLAAAEMARLRLDESELNELCWLPPDIALEWLIEPLRTRVRQGLIALETGQVFELEQWGGVDASCTIRPASKI